MAIDLAEAVFGISADYSSFERSLDRVDEKIESFTKDAGQKFERFGLLTASVLGVAVVGALAKLGQATGDYLFQIDVLANRLGETAEEGSKLIGVFERLGIQNTTATRAATGFALRMEETQKALDPFATKMGRLLGSLRDSSGGLLTMGQALDMARHKISEMTSETDQLTASQDLFGRFAGTRLLQVLRQGDAAWEQFRKEVEASGIVVDRFREQLGQQWQQGISQVQQQLRGIGIELGVAVLPQLLTMAKQIGEVARAVKGWADNNAGLLAFFSSFPSFSNLMVLAVAGVLGLIRSLTVLQGLFGSTAAATKLTVGSNQAATASYRELALATESAALSLQKLVALQVASMPIGQVSAAAGLLPGPKTGPHIPKYYGAPPESEGASWLTKPLFGSEMLGGTAFAAKLKGMIGPKVMEAFGVGFSALTGLAGVAGLTGGFMLKNYIDTFARIGTVQPGGILSRLGVATEVSVEAAGREEAEGKARVEQGAARAAKMREEALFGTTAAQAFQTAKGEAAAAVQLRAQGAETSVIQGTGMSTAQLIAQADAKWAVRQKEIESQLRGEHGGLQPAEEIRLRQELLQGEEAQTQRRASEVSREYTIRSDLLKQEELQLRAQGRFTPQAEIANLEKETRELEEHILRTSGDERRKLITQRDQVLVEIFQAREKLISETVRAGASVGAISPGQQVAFLTGKAQQLLGRGQYGEAADTVNKAKDLALKDFDERVALARQFRIVSFQEDLNYLKQKLEAVKGNAEEEMRILGQVASTEKQLYKERADYAVSSLRTVSSQYKEIVGRPVGQHENEADVERKRTDIIRGLRDLSRGSIEDQALAGSTAQGMLAEAEGILRRGGSLAGTAIGENLSELRSIAFPTAAGGGRALAPGAAGPFAGSLTSPSEGLSISGLANSTEPPKLDTSWVPLASNIRDVLGNIYQQFQGFARAIAAATTALGGTAPQSPFPAPGTFSNNPGSLGQGGGVPVVGGQALPIGFDTSSLTRPFNNTGSFSYNYPPETVVEVKAAIQDDSKQSASQHKEAMAKRDQQADLLQDIRDSLALAVSPKASTKPATSSTQDVLGIFVDAVKGKI